MAGRPKSWFREEMLQHVRQWHALVGRSPKQLEYELGSAPLILGPGPSVPSIQKEFGTWNKFLEAAGLPIRKAKGGTRRKDVSSEL